MKNVVIFFAGVIVGAGASWYAAKTVYQKRLDEDIASVKESFKDVMRQMVHKSNEKAEESISNGSVDKRDYNSVKMAPRASESVVSGVAVEAIDGIDIAEEEHPMDDDEEVSEFDEEVKDEIVSKMEIENAEHEINRNKKPFIITKDQYGEDPRFEPKEFHYYIGDDVLIDPEDFNIMDHAEELDVMDICGDALTNEWIDDENADELYVRNYRLGIDILVTKQKGKFYNEGW